MKTVKEQDRRVRRTRAQLRDALLTLIHEKGFDAVSVQDITDRADMGRATFYLHFKDKEELLFESMREIYDELNTSIHHNQASLEHFMQAISSTDGDSALPHGEYPSEFEHVRQHAAFYKMMFGKQGVASFIFNVREYLEQAVLDILRQMIPPNITPHMPLELVAAYMAGAELGVLNYWVQRDLPYSRDQMERWFVLLCRNTLVMALTPQPPAADTTPPTRC
jgi:AcrR family transcriptional regulator